jgi:tubulin---tyrosine ligase
MLKLLLCNDDGPPSPIHSPYVEAFAKKLKTAEFCKRLEIVLPSTNKSWIGKSVGPSDIVLTSYYDPETGLITDTKTDFRLLSATPASCANISLYHLFDDIDMVISGPNAGRNAGAASTLSSGTIGACLEAVFTKRKAISVSFAIFDWQDAKDPNIIDAAVEQVISIIQQLITAWDTIPSPPAMFNINVPLISRPWKGIEFTTISKTDYKSLFASHKDGSFTFKPTFVDRNDLVKGTDNYAIFNDFISITPLFAELKSDLDLEKYNSLGLVMGKL